jgi:hypothetical protein
MVQAVIVALCLGAVALLMLGLLTWAFLVASREAGIFGMYPEADDAEDEAEMLSRYRARMEVDAREQRARWSGLRKGMEA